MTETEPIDRAELLSAIKRVKEVATPRIARACTRVLMTATRESMELRTTLEDLEISAENLQRVESSYALRQITALAYAAGRADGRRKALAAADLACEFFESNGMAYREFEYEAQRSGSKGASVGNGGRVPSTIRLWAPPAIELNSPPLGSNSLIGVNRESLLSVARRFYALGVRCAWFEKMLVESLIGAELFATVQESRKNPAAWRGQVGLLQTLIWTWAFEKTRGKSPNFEFTAGAIDLAAGLLKLVAVVALAIYSYDRFDANHLILGGLGLLVSGWIGLNMVGRFVARRIVIWAQHPAEKATAALRAAPLAKVLQAMIGTYFQVSAAATNPSLALASLTESSRNGACFDPIVASFLERATSNSEFSWAAFGLHFEPSFDSWDDVELDANS